MISYISGEIKFINEKSVTVLLNGLGYEIFLSSKTIKSLEIGESIEAYIYSHIKEDTFDLFGFVDINDKKMFEALTSVSGIGPKSAMNIISNIDSQSLFKSIINNDVSSINNIQGVGKKMAEKICLELRDTISKLGLTFVENISTNINIANDEDEELFEALKALGYSSKEIKNRIMKIPSSVITLEDKIKFVLTNNLNS